MPVESVKVPAPSCTYWLVPQAAMALLMVAAVPVYAAMVEPHCVHDADGIPPLTPAFVQAVARVGAIIPDHSWACPYEGKQSSMSKNDSECLCVISSP